MAAPGTIVRPTHVEQRRYFAAAPWPKALTIVSALGSMVLAGVGIAAYRAIPVPTGFTHSFGLGVALLFPGLLLGCLLFTVRGYAVTPAGLAVRRLLWDTRFPLSGLRHVSFEPTVCKGSLRIFGNAGLYAFTGLYQNGRLGRFRLFATDLASSVLLELPGRKLVITPAAPHAFVEHMHRLFPATVASSESPAAPRLR